MKTITKLSFCSDMELFEMLKVGDMEVFKELYMRYWSALTKEAERQLSSRLDAKDIVQDLFIALYQKANSIDIKVSVKAYLFRALRHKILNTHRNHKVHRNCHSEILRIQNASYTLHGQLDAKELAKDVNKAIDELPKKCREVFLLSRNWNCSHKLISTKLQISVSTVEKHIVKAIRNIKREINYESCKA